ncbi:RHS repeat-associated core domain-containing protein [Amycolatopsis sp. NPDC001319]|uniref:RHS repeat-associated core domain-containing protein n=1 Tax=unclassified Amycolatopsis TaxID=2618356 RepID=UPI00368E8E09
MLGVVLLAGLSTAIPSPAAAATGRSAPHPEQTKSVPVNPVQGKYRKPPAMPTWHSSPPTWPSGGADITVAQANSAPTRAGALPVWLAPSGHAPSAEAAATQTPAGIHLDLATKAKAAAAGITGPMMSLRHTTSGAGSSSVHLTMGYSQFEDAFGGDWASRLRLVALPGCAATTPDQPKCRTQTPVPFTRDAKAGTLAADVVVPAAPTAKAADSAASAMVLAATSAPSGGGGDFAATSLHSSGSWQAGGPNDSFNWSYPVPVPNVPGGLTPNVTLSYDSQAVDGLTPSTNNQPSWIGDGWDYSPGYVERSYQSCHENPAGPTRTWDNCWSANNTLILSLNGQTVPLIKDDATGTYHPRSDASERVQYVTGAANGAQNGEHFVVTTADGTQYYFGLNQLPGWSSGNPTTNSVLTEPVFSAAAGQPCYNATFANSWCQQAYRWNLDYVVDTHSDVVSYFYNTENNFYSRDLGSTANTLYNRGSYLSKIQYGQRAGQVYSTQPAAQVLFTTTGRCNQASCDPATLSSATASNWPDVPYDLNCANNASCSVQSPSFWSEYALQSIQTQVLVGITETNVDNWALTHTYPATGDSTTPSLWLSSIARTGQDTSAGGSTAAITLPPVVFSGTPLSNRVDLSDGYSPITRQRLTTITTETGETISVGYSSPGCSSGTPADPSQNTTLCYPAYWLPPNQAEPVLDWFNKFIVTGVTEEDPTGGSAHDTIATTYTPVGTPAWHYTEDPTGQPDERTWDQWRGFQGMIVTTGTAPDPVTKTQYTYFRGMDGDTLPNGGTRQATISDSRGDPPVTDSDQFAGGTYETVVYNGSAVVSDTISDPWSSAATASQAVSGLKPLQSFLLDTADTKVYTPLSSGGSRETETDYTHDSHGRVTATDDHGDVSTPADDLCSTTSFADNTTAWILDRPAEQKTVSADCGTTPVYPQDAVADQLTFYDGSTTSGAAPTVGDPTETESAVTYTGLAATSTYAAATASFDEYGRPASTTDPDNRTTQTTYTPATGAEPTQVVVKDPLTFTTTTVNDPVRDLPTSSTDAGGFVTKEQFDALGRLTSVLKPGVSAPSLKYTYTISNIAPSVVDTYTLNFNGTYRLSETLYDALLRSREVQNQTPDNGRDITDTIYNTDGWVSETTNPYFNSDAVSPTYVQAPAGDVPSATGTSYDSAGRKTAAIAYALGNETWRTSYIYGGNFVTTIPPAGSPATTTLADARGNTTDLYRYNAGAPADPTDPPGDYSATHYTYYPNGKQQSVKDAAGNTWSYQYDLLGNQTSAQDPDTGTTTSTYDHAGQLITATDSRGKQTTHAFDADGRKTFDYDTTGNAAPSSSNEIAGWTYDTLKKGYPTSQTSHSGGDVYTQTIRAYNAQAQAEAVTATLTGEGTSLIPAAGYTVSFGYSLTGYFTGHSEPALDGLPSESVSVGYDAFGEPTSLASNVTTYVQAVGYSEFGEPLQYTMPATGGNVWATNTYDPQTHALTDTQTTTSNNSVVVDDTSYTYSGPGVSKGAGLVVSSTDRQNGGATVDTQCYGYDSADRLSQAWTATDNCASTPAPGNSASVGGPTPYWQSWTYDAAGNRRTQTDHNTSGNTAGDTTTTYNYPAQGSATDQPHTLTSTTATGPNATANTASYTYDAAGNTTSITGGSTGDQTLTWNDQNKPSTDVTAAGTTSYVYDEGGNLIVRRDPSQTTFFLGDMQLVLDPVSETTTATRYYSLGGATVAVRSSSGAVQYLVPDRQGTDQLTLNSSTLATTRRQYLPFGQERGTAPSTWPGDKGYVGGTPDPTTQLENLGAREYDPASGRFVSADPVFEQTDPNQMGGYDYAGNDPVTSSDPSGLSIWEPAIAGDVVPGWVPPPPSPPAHTASGHASSNAGGGRAAGGAPPRRAPVAAPVDHSFHLPHWLIVVGAVAAVVGAVACVVATDGLCLGAIAAGATEGSLFGGAGAAAGAAAAAVSEGAGAVAAAGGVTAGAGVAGEMLGDGAGEAVGGEAGAEATAGESAGEAGAAPTPADPPPPPAAKSAPAASAPAEEAPAASPARASSGCNSFAGATAVLMADGSSKPIDQVHVGDTITNAEPDSHDAEQHVVTAVHVTTTDKSFDDLTFSTPDGPATITSTAQHLFWDATLHTWREADNLRVGDEVDTPDNGHVTVVATRLYTAAIVTYNLTVDGVHTYYVLAGDTPVLVHNCNKNQGRYEFEDQQNPGKTYVGKTKNFNNRLQDHIDSGRLKSRGDATCTHVCGTNDDLFVAEHLRMEELRGQGVDLSNDIASPGKKILEKRQDAEQFEQLRLW